MAKTPYRKTFRTSVMVVSCRLIQDLVDEYAQSRNDYRSDYVGYELRADQVAEEAIKRFCDILQDIRRLPSGLSGSFSGFFYDAFGRLAGGLCTFLVLQECYRHGGH